MESKGYFGDNYHNTNIDRGLFGQPMMNPFASYSVTNKFSTPYQFPAVSDSNIFSLGGGAFEQSFPQLHDSTHGFGLKFGNGGGGGGGQTGYGHSSVGAQSHYGPPIMTGGKGGKLKGAALSALTLLAFLFFLNLLQSCLKDQMDAMNPTVMVMSAGQRAVIARNEENEVKKRFDQNYENTRSEELMEYMDDEDYSTSSVVDDGPMTATMTKNHKRIRGKQQQQQQKRHKLKGTIGPKLQNLQLIRSTL